MTTVLTVALSVLLVLYAVQALAKFVIWAAVPYDTRIRKISTYYDRDNKIISTYDTISLITLVAAVILLLLIGTEWLSFMTGLIVGMLLIQTFFHRFDRPLPADRAPQPPAPVRKTQSYAIHDAPQLAWREISVITILLIVGLVGLITTVVSRIS